jgi:hypothetical protein
MPTILPTDWRLQAQSGVTPGEYQTLELLAERLPDELTVFHGLHWTLAAQNYTIGIIGDRPRLIPRAVKHGKRGKDDASKITQKLIVVCPMLLSFPKCCASSTLRRNGPDSGGHDGGSRYGAPLHECFRLFIIASRRTALILL